MNIPKKCMSFNFFMPKKKLLSSESQKMHGKEKVPIDHFIPDENMDSSSNTKGRRLKLKNKCHRSISRVFKAVKSKKKQNRKNDDDLPISCISVLDDALRPLKDNTITSDDGDSGGENILRPYDAESIGVSSGYSMFSSSMPSSSCTSIANSRSGSQRKQTTSCVMDLKAACEPLMKNDCPVKMICSERNHLVYFFLVCLVGLVFGGKAFAILLTASCLFLLPCCLRQFVASTADDDVDSKNLKGKK